MGSTVIHGKAIHVRIRTIYNKLHINYRSTEFHYVDYLQIIIVLKIISYLYLTMSTTWIPEMLGRFFKFE